MLCSELIHDAVGRVSIKAATLQGFRGASRNIKSRTDNFNLPGGYGLQVHCRAGSGSEAKRVPYKAPRQTPQPMEAKQPLQQYYVTCHPGLEEVVASELRSPQIRAGSVRAGKAGVSFVGDAAIGYRANLWLRSAIRVLQYLAEAEMDPRRPGGDEVYRIAREAVDWTHLLQQGHSFSVDARLRSCSRITNSQLLSVRVKDAICDAIRDKRGAKPLPPAQGRTADLPLYCTAFQDRVTIFRDLSGESLHRRGYRRAMHRASLNESAAAGLLYLAGWDELCRQEGEAVLADPMCGSGTFLIEAALMASDTAPGLFRRFWPFHSWPDFDRQAWREAWDQAAAARHAPHPGVSILGNDVHGGALALALRDAESARVTPAVRLNNSGCREWTLPAPPQLVMCNPPWGQRLMGGKEESGASQDGAAGSTGRFAQGPDGRVRGGAVAAGEWGLDGGGSPPGGNVGGPDLAGTWHDLSVFLKEQCGGSEAYLLSGNVEATKHLRLRADQKWALGIGGVDCRLLKYSIRGRPPVPAA